MSTRFTRWSVNTIVGGLFIFLSSGCAVTGDGYYGGPSVGVGVDYYDSFGFDYGPWGPNYQVGPYGGGAQRPRRDGGDHPRGDGGNGPGHNYRPAPPSHSVPSIPSRPRPGGRKPSDGQHR